MSQNNIDILINVETNNAESNINKTKKSLDNLSNSSKVANKSVSSLNKSFQQIGSVSQILPNNLKNFASSLANITKVATPIAAVGVSVKAISFGFNEAYKNSEKFRSEIDTLKNSLSSISAPVFEEIGDALGGIVGKVNEWVEAQSRLNGAIAQTNQAQLEAIKNAGKNAEENAENELKRLEELGATADEINGRRLNGLRNIQNITEQTYNDAIALQEKYRKDIKEINALLVDLKEKKDNVNIMDLDAAGNNPYEEQFKKAMDTHVRLVSQNMELREKILPAIKEKYKEINSEIARNTTSKTVKEEKDLLEQLREKLAEVKQIRIYENDLNNENLEVDDEKQQYYQRQLNSLKQQQSIVNSIYNEERKRGINNEKTIEQYHKINEEIAKIEKLIKGKLVDAAKTWQEKLIEITTTTNTIYSNFSSIIQASVQVSMKSLASYDKAIYEAQKKLDAFNKWKEKEAEKEKEQSIEDYEDRLRRLDEELIRAREIGDEMSAIAIENAKDKIASQKKVLEKEKAINDEEKRLEYELALAEYNKEYANWQNEVKAAQTEKAMAISDAIMTPATAAAYASIGLAQSFAQLGPIAGPIVGALVSASVIAQAISGAANIKSASASLDTIQNTPPIPPAFQYGTAGYNVPVGGSVLVGEAGPELLTLKGGGDISVMSNAQTKTQNLGGNMYVENLIFNVDKIVDDETIFKAMNNYKIRNGVGYRR